MRVLVLGATGMLGHKLVQRLADDFEVVATRRSGDTPVVTPAPVRFDDGLDALDGAALAACLDRVRPAAVLNAVGLVKQVMGKDAKAAAVAVNALLPNRLAALAAERGIRLVHFSTDCVFSGARDSARGPDGYREVDPPDARDVYGLSKLLGEPDLPGALTLRTSIVGPELRARQGLLEWFLAQGDRTVDGYAGALFSGLPTVTLARLVARILVEQPRMDGLWHVAAPPIAKYDLLGLFRDAWKRPTRIRPETAFYCDRRLDGSRFATQTGWSAASWPELVAEMRADAA